MKMQLSHDTRPIEEHYVPVRTASEPIQFVVRIQESPLMTLSTELTIAFHRLYHLPHPI